MARSGSIDTGAQYSPAVGMVFVFNLIVGTGALAMPKAFQGAGWLISIILISCIAFTSYVTVTYIVETMACANAILLYRRRTASATIQKSSSESSELSAAGVLPETEHLLSERIADDYFRIRERVELGQMVSLFFNKAGVIVFYICITIYLYGDLAIYAAAVPKSLRDVVCTYRQNVTNCSCNSTGISMEDSLPCWAGIESVTRMSAYRIFVVLFVLLLGPFVFFNVQKTMVLQVLTSLLRWLAFLSMIILAIVQLSTKGAQGSPPVADFSKVPNLFGVCVYSFMCHHSLPSLVTPIRKKGQLNRLFAGDYILVLSFYVLLAMTGMYAFSNIPDLYTLTFRASQCDGCSNPAPAFFQYFLALFPVFTLSTSYPIIGITLRNNLKSLMLRDGVLYPFIVDRIAFPLIVLLPPMAVSLITNDLQFLVGITGSYSGAALQYFVPAALVYYGRKTVMQTFGVRAIHKIVSPFRSVVWVVLIIAWAIGCIILVTVYHILSKS